MNRTLPDGIARMGPQLRLLEAMVRTRYPANFKGFIIDKIIETDNTWIVSGYDPLEGYKFAYTKDFKKKIGKFNDIYDKDGILVCTWRKTREYYDQELNKLSNSYMYNINKGE